MGFAPVIIPLLTESGDPGRGVIPDMISPSRKMPEAAAAHL